MTATHPILRITPARVLPPPAELHPEAAAGLGIGRGVHLHYRVRVVELGDDGDSYGMPGHVTRRRAISAVRRYLRVDAQLDRDDMGDLTYARVSRRWVTVTGDAVDGDDRWTWSMHKTTGAHPITVVDL